MKPSYWVTLILTFESLINIIIVLFTFLFTSSIHSLNINGVGSLPIVYQLYP